MPTAFYLFSQISLVCVWSCGRKNWLTELILVKIEIHFCAGAGDGKRQDGWEQIGQKKKEEGSLLKICTQLLKKKGFTISQGWVWECLFTPLKICTQLLKKLEKCLQSHRDRKRVDFPPEQPREDKGEKAWALCRGVIETQHDLLSSKEFKQMISSWDVVSLNS